MAVLIFDKNQFDVKNLQVTRIKEGITFEQDYQKVTISCARIDHIIFLLEEMKHEEVFEEIEEQQENSSKNSISNDDDLMPF
jgi:t-SNARE complex subunit (syntaxin)